MSEFTTTTTSVEKQTPVRKTRVFLGVAHGEIFHKNKETGSNDIFSELSGKLTSIKERSATINGAPITFFDFTIETDDKEYVLSLNRNSSVACSLVNTLASVDDFSKTIVVKAYETEANSTGRKFTNISVYLGSADKQNKLSWKTTLPKVQYRTLGSRSVPDDSDRLDVINSLIEDIRLRLIEDIPF